MRIVFILYLMYYTPKKSKCTPNWNLFDKLKSKDTKPIKPFFKEQPKIFGLNTSKGFKAFIDQKSKSSIQVYHKIIPNYHIGVEKSKFTDKITEITKMMMTRTFYAEFKDKKYGIKYRGYITNLGSGKILFNQEFYADESFFSVDPKNTIYTYYKVQSDTPTIVYIGKARVLDLDTIHFTKTNTSDFTQFENSPDEYSFIARVVNYENAIDTPVSGLDKNIYEINSSIITDYDIKDCIHDFNKQLNYHEYTKKNLINYERMVATYEEFVENNSENVLTWEHGSTHTGLIVGDYCANWNKEGTEKIKMFQKLFYLNMGKTNKVVSDGLKETLEDSLLIKGRKDTFLVKKEENNDDGWIIGD